MGGEVELGRRDGADVIQLCFLAGALNTTSERSSYEYLLVNPTQLYPSRRPVSNADGWN